MERFFVPPNDNMIENELNVVIPTTEVSKDFPHLKMTIFLLGLLIYVKI